jgi:tetratricopeptide (TPR) repeat protein
MAPEDEAAFVTDFRRDVHALLGAVTVNTEKAESGKREFQDGIQEAIRTSVGFLDINNRIVGKLRDWMVERGRALLAATARELGPDSSETLRCMHDVAVLLLAQGRPAEAEALLRDVLKRSGGGIGGTNVHHPHGSLGQHGLGDASSVSGHGQHQHRRSLSGTAAPPPVVALGDAETFACQHDLAVALQEQNKLDEAKALYRSALRGRRLLLLLHNTPSSPRELLATPRSEAAAAPASLADEMLGAATAPAPSAPDPLAADSLSTAHCLATLLLAQGEYAEGAELFEEAVARRRSILGPDHRDTLASLHWQGVLLHAWARALEGDGVAQAECLQQGEAVLRQAKEGRQRVLGTQHPDTLASMTALASLLNTTAKQLDGSKLDESRAEREEAATLHRDALGNDRQAEFTGTESKVSADVACFVGQLNAEADSDIQGYGAVPTLWRPVFYCQSDDTASAILQGGLRAKTMLEKGLASSGGAGAT